MKRFFSLGCVLMLTAVALMAQQSAETSADQSTTASGLAEPPREPKALREREDPSAGSIEIPEGTRIPLVLINSISTKHAAPGDRVYLESVYPVVVDGRIVVPPGTYVSGSVTSSKRPGRVKGRGELFLRFEQMILPNGIIRDLIGRVGSLDGRSPEGFDREEGKITSESNKGSDARTVGRLPPRAPRSASLPAPPEGARVSEPVSEPPRGPPPAWRAFCFREGPRRSSKKALSSTWCLPETFSSPMKS